MNKNNKFIIIVFLILFTISIGYSILSSTLNINGRSNISKNTWDIHLENIKVTDGSVEAIKGPTIVNNTSIDFEAKLNLPGDYYEFSVDVVNNGTIDAMVDSIIKEPELTDAQKKYLNYTIEYQNREQINSKQLLKSNELVRLNVRVEIKKDVNVEDLPSESDVLQLGFSINYVQADGDTTLVKDNGVRFVFFNGDYNEVGTVVTIGNEQFYTIGTEGDNIKLLSKLAITLEDSPVQSSNAGDTAYSISDAYFHGSLVEGYLNNYKAVIEKMGVSVIDATLIKYEELNSEIIGCKYSDCINAPSWITSFSYYIYNDDVSSVYFVNDYKSIGSLNYYQTTRKVRPVIVISKDYY